MSTHFIGSRGGAALQVEVASSPLTSHAYMPFWVSSTELLNWKNNRTSRVSFTELLRQHSDWNTSHLSDHNCKQASMSCSMLASVTNTRTVIIGPPG